MFVLSVFYTLTVFGCPCLHVCGDQSAQCSEGYLVLAWLTRCCICLFPISLSDYFNQLLFLWSRLPYCVCFLFHWYRPLGSSRSIKYACKNKRNCWWVNIVTKSGDLTSSLWGLVTSYGSPFYGSLFLDTTLFWSQWKLTGKVHWSFFPVDIILLFKPKWIRFDSVCQL